MNIRSAELLQSSLQNAAQNELRNRELVQSGQLERQRLAVENAFRAAQMAHYNQMENRQQGFYNRIQQEQEDRAILAEQNTARQENQYAAAQKQGALKTIMGLNATGQLTPEGLKRVNHWLTNDPDFGKTGIQLAAPANPDTSPQHMQTALAQGLALRQNVQSMYDTEKDPAKKAEYGKQLEDIDTYFQGKDATRMNGNAPGAQPYRGKQSRAREQADPNAAMNAPAQAGPLPTGGTPSGINGPGNLPAQAAADPRAIQWLSQNPTPQNVAAFEGIYGQGSSAPFLNPKGPAQK